MKKKLGVLVGAAPLGAERGELEELVKQDSVYKIAVDGGIVFFLESRIRPDYWLGDMDSSKEKDVLSGKTKSTELFLSKIKSTQVSPIKDDTDMAMAVNHAFETGCDEVIIYGGTGGARMAHTFANLQLLHHFAKEGKKVTMVSERNRLFVLCDGKIEFPKKADGLISVFSLSDISEGVSIKGLFYEFEGILTNDRALGVSNEFCGKTALIEVKKGALLIVYEP